MHQEELRFDEAEAGFHERLNMVNLALQRIEADIYLCRLLERVFHLTSGGREGEWVVKSYDELGSRPLWLCCSRSKARSTVGTARHRGILRVQENRYASASQKANGYAIDWEGVRRVLSGRIGAGRPRQSDQRENEQGGMGDPTGRPPASDLVRRQGGMGASRGHPPVSTKHPHASTEQGGALSEHPSGDLLGISGRSSVPGPDSGPAREPGVFSRHPELAQVPELVAAADTEVAALPLGGLAYGVFAPLKERHLRQPRTLLDWHARQLSVASPVVGASLAEAILVVAAGKYAANLPAGAVHKSRVAVFCYTVAKEEWRRVLRYVPEASREVESALAQEVTHG